MARKALNQLPFDLKVGIIPLGLVASTNLLYKLLKPYPVFLRQIYLSDGQVLGFYVLFLRRGIGWKERFHLDKRQREGSGATQEINGGGGERQ
ncbi:hypothetical protein RRG08_047661 [Elysia crispata]|uniref:Uncharacterized protein n=1 Tax=Elysia crispata TaxID=231223 RepID=A0AAE1BEI0_9GAST|nr:hypothetical protein RRG08_047661 [Elysia crispata]